MEVKEIVKQEIERQAKFGYEPSWEDFVIAGQMAGKREVVDTIIEDTRNFEVPLSLGLIVKLKEWGVKICTRCGATRTDNVISNVCGSCADDLRTEANADTGTD